ncbi:LOW QUALITY PROTEIN: INO80 complex subunit C [Colossoma macropomum]|uniref:LOW QUALITY PROTEIN: INO80 complex subunit C n=1 Tax=Colossoma macropomum TaxID=42526 RepID=UPI0018650258|nr:LOW QUALITY PROTEIN: INO80 complex subunit C [Colossoma macropomum]
MAAPSTPGSSLTGEFSSAVAGTIKLVPVLTAAQSKGKKRAASPASAQPLQTNSSKKKKVQSSSGAGQAQIVVVDSADGKLLTAADVCPPPAEPVAKPLPFKDPKFVHSGIGGAAAGKKNRTWKNLKQILAAERALPWKISDPNYYNIDAPPSMKPPKKYSDISGLPANYTDPQTKLRFTSSEEFSYIRLLPTDVVAGYLALRKATCIVP